MYKTYGLWGCFILLKSWVFTRIFYSSAKLIMLPSDIRGKKSITWGSGFRMGFGCRLEAYPEGNGVVMHIGNNVQIHDYVHITAVSKVVIGDNVLLASKIYISDSSHGNYSAGDNLGSSPLISPALRPISSKEVVIGNRVWIGESVSILPGVIIGDGSIIGANSVVSKSIPANVIAVGAPARPIKKFNFETQSWDPLKEINND
ncbi:MAG: DapH/DapD/GlmU-related protein [Pedobacter sp.]|uniref:DapH/DapD/GlmU-related protein n=1 Tax=Pedobacter sp. TaxID=1411316 RepID=UPI003562C2D1